MRQSTPIVTIQCLSTCNIRFHPFLAYCQAQALFICFHICYVMFIFLFFFLLILPVNFLFIIIIFFFSFFLFFSHTSCTLFPTNKPLHPQCRRRIILEYEGALYRIEVEVMRAYQANDFIRAHTSYDNSLPPQPSCSRHTYKSRVVSRSRSLRPLTYLPGTSVGKKITPPGHPGSSR